MDRRAIVLLQVLLVVAGVAGSLWVLYRIAALVLALILAAAFAYVIAPLVRLAERAVRLGAPHRRSRGVAIALVYFVIALVVGGGGALLLPRVAEQLDDMRLRTPAYTESMLAWEEGWSRYYDHLGIPPALRRNIDQSIVTAGTGAIDKGRGALLSFVGMAANLPWLILIPVFAFFFLKDASRLRRSLLAALPHRHRLRAHRLLDELNGTFAAFVRAQLIACVLVGALCGAGFAALGTPYPVVLGVLAGLLEFIPLVGPLLLATIASIVGALHSPVLVLWTIGFLGILRLAQDYVMYPRLIGRGIHLEPLPLILSVLVGAELDGVAGMFLAVPAVAFTSVVVHHWADWRRSVSDAPESDLLP